jgi:hypothetical protein
MVKQFVFNFKLDAEDRRLLVLLARHLQRTQADSIRWLIRQAAARLAFPPDRDAALPFADPPEDFARGIQEYWDEDEQAEAVTR